MTILNLFLGLTKVLIIITTFLALSMLLAFLKRELNVVFGNLFEKCFDWAGRFYSTFITKLSGFHSRLTSDYKEKMDIDAKEVLLSEANNSKMQLISKLNTTLDSIELFGKNVASDIRNAVDSVNFKHVELIQSNNNQLIVSLNAISKLTTPDKSIDISVKGKLWFAYLLTAVVLFFNTFLLAQFFRDIFMLNLPIIRHPRIELAHPLAMIFGMLEIACGWIYSHQVLKEQSDEYSPTTGSYKFWIILGFSFLIIVELYSFAALSARVNIADILQIPKDNVLYMVSFYFMAFFGLGLGIIEFMLGLYISELSETRNMEKVSNRSMDYISRIKKQSQTVLESVVPLNEKLARFKSTIEHLPEKSGEILKSLSASDDIPSSVESLVAKQISEIKHKVQNESIPVLIPSSNQDVYQKVLRDFALTVVWSLLTFTACVLFKNNFLITLGLIYGNIQVRFAYIMSLFLVATLILTGFGYQRIHIKSDKGSNKGIDIRIRTIITFTILIVTIGLVTYLIHLKHESGFYAFLLGVLLPLAIFYFSSLLYQAFLSLSFCIQITFLTTIWALIYVTRTIFLFVSGVFALIFFYVINIISAPGVIIIETIRRKTDVH